MASQRHNFTTNKNGRSCTPKPVGHWIPWCFWTYAGGVWFRGPALSPRHTGNDKPSTNPIVWRCEWPQHIKDALITEENPFGTLTNSDLELAGGLLHLEAIANNFKVRERSILSKIDNLATLYWQRKGSSTTTKAPAHLLRLFGIHQRYHDYISGKSNPLADDSSQLFYLSDSDFLTHLNTTFQQPLSFRLVQILSKVVSSVISALHRKTCSMESLLADLLPQIHTGKSGLVSSVHWALVPLSKPSKTKYRSYKSSSTEYVPEHHQPAEVHLCRCFKHQWPDYCSHCRHDRSGFLFLTSPWWIHR